MVSCCQLTTHAYSTYWKNVQYFGEVVKPGTMEMETEMETEMEMQTHSQCCTVARSSHSLWMAFVDHGEFEAMKTPIGRRAPRCDKDQFRAKMTVST